MKHENGHPNEPLWPPKDGFEFATAQRIVFGRGQRHRLPELTRQLGMRPAFITGSNRARHQELMDALCADGCEPTPFHMEGEPTVEAIRQIAEEARKQACDCIVAVGGGSVVDSGKALAALLTNRGDLMRYLEVVGEGHPLEEEPAPCIVLPTTAGTGAEATCNAVLTVLEKRVKVSLRHPALLPTIALVDPELTYTVSPEHTAATGLDALTQLIEAFTSRRANPLTDSFCRTGILHAARALPLVVREEPPPSAREDMAVASLLSGMALANAGLGAVHGFAGPIGGMFNAPHGQVCAALLPAVLRTNIQALAALDPHHPYLNRYREIACLLTDSATASPADAIHWVENLCNQLQMPTLTHFGITAADIPEIIARAQCASSMKGNPIECTPNQLEQILHQSMALPRT